MLALGVKDLIPTLSLEELEEGCEAFLEDIEIGEDLGDVDFLFPFLIKGKLDLYEAEY